MICHVISGVDWHNNRAVRCFVLLRKIMFSNRSEFDHESYMILHNILYMGDANPLDYMVSTLSKPRGSPVYSNSQKFPTIKHEMRP